jgi:hypothetical protein
MYNDDFFVFLVGGHKGGPYIEIAGLFYHFILSGLKKKRMLSSRMKVMSGHPNIFSLLPLIYIPFLLIFEY